MKSIQLIITDLNETRFTTLKCHEDWTVELFTEYLVDALGLVTPEELEQQGTEG